MIWFCGRFHNNNSDVILVEHPIFYYFYFFLQCNPDDLPDWKEFSGRMYKGYELAIKRNRPISFKFKGVETTLYPDQQEVDDQMVEIRLKDVLKELNRVSNVSYFFLENMKTQINCKLFYYVNLFISLI